MSSPAPNAFPGTAPFADTEIDRDLFCGRDSEADQLTSQILSSSLVVLFGRSGLGKTSLIAAGVLQKLRSRGCFPIVTRLIWTPGRESTQNSLNLLTIDSHQSLVAQVLETAEKRRVPVKFDPQHSSLWSFFSSARCGAEDAPLQPVLIIDQFEELFSRLEPASREQFIDQFADLVGNRVPEALRLSAEQQLNAMGPRSQKGDESNSDREQLVRLAYGDIGHNAKILIAIREDFLPQLEELKKKIPTIFRTMFQLMPLTDDQARSAIAVPPTRIAKHGGKAFSFDPEAVDEMIAFLKIRIVNGKEVPGDSIESLKLQILCQNLDAQRAQLGRSIVTKKDLGGVNGMWRIIDNYYDNYYRRVVGTLPSFRLGWNGRRFIPWSKNWILFNLPRSAARYLCEMQLITPQGQRNSLQGGFIERTFGVIERDLNTLANAYLLRAEPRLGMSFYELSQDSLVRTLIVYRRRRQMRKTIVVGLLLPLIAGIAFISLSKPLQLFWVELFIPDNRKVAQNTDAIPQDRSKAIQSLAEAQARLSLLGEKPKDADILRFSRQNFPTLDLRGIKAAGLNFSLSTLDDAKFDSARLVSPDFTQAIIRNSSFHDAIFEQADFSLTTIQNVNFDEASIKDGKFNTAKLKLVHFRGADLVSANFSRAIIDDVDFSGSDLRYTSFANAQIVKADFRGSSWWIAKGFERKMREQFKKQYPREDFIKSVNFKNEIQKQLKAIADAKTDAVRSSEMNDYAWYLAICGEDLDTAKEYATEALKIILKMKEDPKSKYIPREEANTADTLAYILMQKKEMGRAAELLKNATELADRERLRDGSFYYRYALVLSALGDKENAIKMKERADFFRYEPSHELLLMEEPIRLMEALTGPIEGESR